MTTGWQARFDGAAFTLAQAELGDPLPPGRLRARFVAGGICGTDVGMLRAGGSAVGRPGWPLHELVGEVVDPGGTAFAQGELVVGWAAEYDGLAEFVECEAEQLARVPESLLDDPLRALIAQPLSTVLCALDRIGPVAGLEVAVLGLGSIGLLFAQQATARGAHVTGFDIADRAALAGRFGAERFVRGEVRELTREWAGRFAVVIEAIGHEPAVQASAVDYLAPHGTLYFFGVPDDEELTLPFRALFYANARVLLGVTSDHARHLAAALDRLAEPSVARGYVTDVLTTAELDRAFGRAGARTPRRIKVAIVPAGVTAPAIGAGAPS